MTRITIRTLEIGALLILCSCNFNCGWRPNQWQSNPTDAGCIPSVLSSEMLAPSEIYIVPKPERQKCEQLLDANTWKHISAPEVEMILGTRIASPEEGQFFLIRGVCVSGTEHEGYFTVCMGRNNEVVVTYMCRDAFSFRLAERFPLIVRLRYVPKCVRVLVYRDSDRGSIWGKSLR